MRVDDEALRRVADLRVVAEHAPEAHSDVVVVMSDGIGREMRPRCFVAEHRGGEQQRKQERKHGIARGAPNRGEREEAAADREPDGQRVVAEQGGAGRAADPARREPGEEQRAAEQRHAADVTTARTGEIPP